MTAETGHPHPNRTRAVAVWDVPTRLFHWLLVLLVVVSWWSADARRMDWHRYSGYAVLGLLAFRILWGSSDPRRRDLPASSARRRPRCAIFAESRRASATIPSGPGACSQCWVCWSCEVGLGLFAVDVDGFESGPLSDRVSFEAGRQAAEWHHLAFNALLTLIALHVAAVIGHLVFRRENLIGPMISGSRRCAEDREPMRPQARSVLALCVALAALAAWAVARGLRF